MAEPVPLRRALFNSVQNALRYTKRGGVLVTARQRRKHVRVEVWDTGAGITPEHLPDIFSPYYQVHNPQRDPSQGLGLGLAIFKECVRLMRGTYGVRSVPGRGSVFWFALAPVPADTVATIRAGRDAARAEDARIETLHGTVLVVDDDSQIRTAWIALMEAWGSVSPARHTVPMPIACWPRAAARHHLLRPAPAGQRERPRPARALAEFPTAGAQRPADRRPEVRRAGGGRRGGLFRAVQPVDLASLRLLLRRWLRPA